ncbi:hypothetical protein LB505_001030 [Fusarium chuoi]|nr:hypothetical protein LB505_001030 [Fusarium chuoi]
MTRSYDANVCLVVSVVTFCLVCSKANPAIQLATFVPSTEPRFRSFGPRSWLGYLVTRKSKHPP